MHDEEEVIYAGAGFPGIEKREELAGKSMEHCLAMGPGQRRALPDTEDSRLLDLMQSAKVHVHVKVDHSFRVIETKSAGSHSRIQLSEDSTAGPGSKSLQDPYDGCIDQPVHDKQSTPSHKLIRGKACPLFTDHGKSRRESGEINGYTPWLQQN